MSGVSRFDCYPSDFLNGIVGLSADQIAAYTVILMMQYDRGSNVRYGGREKEIAVRSGMSRARLAKAIDELVAAGKLKRDEDLVSNDRATREIARIGERIAKNRENSAKGGVSTFNKFSTKRNKINENDRPVGQPDGRPKQGPIPSSFVPRPEEREEELTDVSSKKSAHMVSRPKAPNRDPIAILMEALSPDVAAGVVEFRRKLRKPLTAMAADGLAKAFKDTGVPDAAARMMVEQGWQGFRRDWFDRVQQKGSGNGKRTIFDVIDCAQARLDELPDQRGDDVREGTVLSLPATRI